MLIILNQKCLKCDYRFEWKSQINAIIPTDEDQHLIRDTEVSPETQQVGSVVRHPAKCQNLLVITPLKCKSV